MARMLLGIGDLGATAGAGDEIRTLALGSCVAVILHDPQSGCVAMDHVALPESAASPERAKQKPGYFADTGIPLLLDTFKRAGGGAPNVHRLVVKLVGGANVLDTSNTFNIGKRNVLAIKKLLWKYGLGPRAEEVGGSISRTVSVFCGTGKVVVYSPGRGEWEI